MTYAIPYLILLTFYAVLAFFYDSLDDPQRKKQITIVSILVFFMFFAFRGYLYTDWISYVKYMENVEWDNIVSFDFTDPDGKEPGFALLAMLCKVVFDDYFFLVFVCTTIDTILFFRFLHRRGVENIPLTLMLFITFEGLVIMFNLLRNAISMFLFMNALEYIEKRKPVQYFSICLLALSLHMSSLLFFPLYFFMHRKMNRWVFISVFFACFLFYVSKLSIVLTVVRILGLEESFGTKIEAYTEIYSSSRALSISVSLEKMGLAMLVFLYYDEIIARFKGRVIIINCLLAYYVLYYMLAEFNTLSYRMSMLFLFTYWILWGDIVKTIYVANNRKIVSSVLFLYCFYITMLAINTPCQEYDNILFGAKGYQERLTILNRTYQEEE